MVVDECNAYDFVALGECIVVLRNPASCNAPDFFSNREESIRRLKERGLDATLAAAQRLANYVITKVIPGNSIAPYDAKKLEEMARTVYSVLSHESKLATVIVTNHLPPDALINLATRLGRPINTTQEALQHDLLTCLKTQLARPAIVMAWALGYDLVRSWIYDSTLRRAAFNQQLAKSPKKGEPVAVVNYSDFFQIGEWRFLEVCRDSQDATLQDFNDKISRHLQHLLDQRNEFAHANDSVATPNEAIAYVERIVRVVTSPPFDKL